MKPISAVGVEKIHIHEDDEGLCVLYPAIGLGAAQADLDKSKDAASRNLAPGGVGWTDIHVIEGPSESIEGLEMPLARIETLIAPHLPRVGRYVATASGGFDENVRDPYGVYLDDPWCFGFDNSCFVFVRGKGAIAHDIWYIKDTSDPAQLSSLKAALLALASEWPLCLTDYVKGQSGALSDQHFVDTYFSPDEE